MYRAERAARGGAAWHDAPAMRRVRSLLTLAIVLGLLVLPALAGAQASPFQPLPAAPAPTTPTPTVASTNTTSNSSLGDGAEILIGIGAVLLLGGIGYGIWWDARRRAPAVAGDSLYEEPDSAPHAKKKQQRAKAKRARQARKRNRRR
jgi:hypothetical protein